LDQTRYQDIYKLHQIGVMIVSPIQEKNVLIVAVHTIAKNKVLYRVLCVIGVMGTLLIPPQNRVS